MKLSCFLLPLLLLLLRILAYSSFHALKMDLLLLGQRRSLLLVLVVGVALLVRGTFQHKGEHVIGQFVQARARCGVRGASPNLGHCTRILGRG